VAVDCHVPVQWLLTNVEIQISYNLHKLQNTPLLLISYQPLKDVKATLHSQVTIQKQVAGQI
jgi:hypothetical protein